MDKSKDGKDYNVELTISTKADKSFTVNPPPEEYFVYDPEHNAFNLPKLKSENLFLIKANPDLKLVKIILNRALEQNHLSLINMGTFLFPYEDYFIELCPEGMSMAPGKVFVDYYMVCALKQEK